MSETDRHPEPVAWQCREHGGAWKITDNPKWHRRRGNGVRPLYATPTLAPYTREAIRTATLEEVAAWHDADTAVDAVLMDQYGPDFWNQSDNVISAARRRTHDAAIRKAALEEAAAWHDAEAEYASKKEAHFNGPGWRTHLGGGLGAFQSAKTYGEHALWHRRAAAHIRAIIATPRSAPGDAADDDDEQQDMADEPVLNDVPTNDPAWQNACPKCDAKPDDECCSLVSGCTFDGMHAERKQVLEPKT